MSELYCRIPANWIADPSLCLFEWQTLVGGLLAILAAGAGSFLLYSRIKQSERHELERRGRKFAASRATLPLALSEVTLFARRMVTWLENHRAYLSSAALAANPVDPPSIGDDLIRNLQEFIEATYNTVAVDHISEIIREIQVLSSRAESLILDSSMIGMTFSVDEYVVQAARLHVITGHLFGFARGKDKGPPDSISWDEVGRYLSVQHHIDEDSHPGVYSILQRRGAAWSSVWPPIRQALVEP
ncbi:MAG: hypothetical protein ABL926_13220 [Novosphingobium sp.]|uniref:hypothetical protein n=1 Tax=Novosphingobium sp. TaxID=1874826 RepID=UPI0032B72C34